VGVYKDNEVIWISEPVYKEAVWGEFEYTQDLNKDGNVELIHTWKIYDMYGPILTTYLHVISWDGQKGVFVNDGGMNTRIEEDRAIIDIADLNKDGISEIIAISEEYNEISGEWKKWKTVFCWNGTLYGKWADCPEWPDPTRDPYYPFTAANDFKIEINSKVRRYEDRFEYSMHVKNLAESNQGIRQFFYQHYADSLSWLKPVNWQKDQSLDGKLVGVTALEDSQIINPGNEEYFAHKSPGLPKIADGYFLSAYQELDLSLILDNFWYYRDKNIINNSVNVKMLSPANPPDPLIPSEFLDTLITYADSSYSLGWIKDEQTKSKYENYFAYAKEKLANGDRAFAKSYLQKVLTDVDVDSTSLLSSEAYALLRYNTEYLLKQIEQ
jgi:hypothetical protein